MRDVLNTAGRWARALLVALLAMQLAWGPVWAEAVKPKTPSNGLNLTVKICGKDAPCFKSVAERQQWGRDHGCQFLEDICKDPDGRNRAEQAAPAKAGWLSDIWNGLKDQLHFAWDFVKGFWEGVKRQISDLADLIINPAEVAKGLIELGKALINDPAGTIKAVGQLLAQGVVDDLNRATKCGAWDLGNVLGQNISPAVMLKVATKLSKYAGDLSRAVGETKKELGCASFVADTPVWGVRGTMAIQGIRIGQTVASRDDRLWSETPQKVTNVFGRVAPSYREIRTEFETYRLTDEHPVWVQGQGWTEAKNLTDDDVVATKTGDVRVRENIAIAEPVRVFNFSVDKTPSYFVGHDGLWVHNAKCDLPIPYKAPISPSGYKLGASDGGLGTWRNIGREDNQNFQYEKQITGAPSNIEYQVNGINFDGYDPNRRVLIDAKNYSENNAIVKGGPQFLINKELAQAKDQVIAAKGMKIEWHVANKKAADNLNDLFFKDETLSGKITAIFSPNISS